MLAGERPDEDDRPLGVMLVSILFTVGALVAFIAGGIALWRAFTAPVGDANVPDAALRGYGVLAGLLVLVFAGIAGTISYGLWHGNRAAWGLALFVAALGVLFAMTGILFGDWASGLLVVAGNGVVAWYLLSPTAREWFRVTDGTIAWHERAA